MRFRRHGPSLVVDTPAKLNLFLEVLGRRPDGYHELETVMVSIGLYDTLRFAPADDDRLVLHTRLAVAPLRDERPLQLSAGDDNLVLRAARLLREQCGVRAGATIELVKRIPWQAGLGGGSSDAAATLAALNRLWSLGLSREELHALAASLGSDVNFFLDSPPLALCRGRGEQIEPRPLNRPLHFVVAQPAGGLSTAEVFRGWSADGERVSSDELLSGLSRGFFRGGRVPLHNGLEKPAAAMHDGVRRVLTALEGSTLEGSGTSSACLSGSGSSCFVCCRSQREARRLMRRLRAVRNCRAFVVSSRT